MDQNTTVLINIVNTGYIAHKLIVPQDAHEKDSSAGRKEILERLAVLQSSIDELQKREKEMSTLLMWMGEYIDMDNRR